MKDDFDESVFVVGLIVFALMVAAIITYLGENVMLALMLAPIPIALCIGLWRGRKK